MAAIEVLQAELTAAGVDGKIAKDIEGVRFVPNGGDWHGTNAALARYLGMDEFARPRALWAALDARYAEIKARLASAAEDVEATGAELIVADLDGTVIEGYMDAPKAERDFAKVAIFASAAGQIAAARAAGKKVAIATNQAGVAFGYQSVEETEAKFQRVAQLLGYRAALVADGRQPIRQPAPNELLVCVCYAHPDAEPWRDTLARRKPSGAMIREAAQAHGVPLEHTLYVGDREEDNKAAGDAGVAFLKAEWWRGV